MPDFSDGDRKFMKCIIMASLLFLQSPVNSHAAEPVPADADVCTEILRKAFDTILSRHDPLSGKTIRLAYSHGIPLSAITYDALEAFMTSRGFSITDDYLKADITLDIAVTDISIVLLKIDDRYNRSVSLTVHIKAADRSQTVRFASGTSESAQDTIPKKRLKSTDNGHRFSREAHRSAKPENHIMIMTGTLIVIIGTLAYFASR
jgi:hypothetical protein